VFKAPAKELSAPEHSSLTALGAVLIGRWDQFPAFPFSTVAYRESRSRPVTKRLSESRTLVMKHMKRLAGSMFMVLQLWLVWLRAKE